MKFLKIKRYFKENKIKNRTLCALLSATIFTTVLTGCSSGSKEYTVSFDGNGGSLVAGTLNQNVSKPDEIVAPTFEMRGYAFDDWDIPLNTITETTTVKAEWNISSYIINYHLDGGKNNPQNPNRFNVLSSNIFLKDASKNGYSFDYWSDSNGNRITTVYPGDAKSIDVYAHYKTVGYSISYELNGGKVSSAPSSYNIETETMIPDAFKEGYAFNGWSMYQNGNDAQTGYKIPKGTYGDIKLYAIFTANDYVITYDVNGGEALASSTQTVTYDSPFVLKTPHRNGYTFNGWKNGSTFVESGDAWKISRDVTLVASWGLNTYSISYNLNGGTNHSLNRQAYTYEDDSFTLYDPMWVGYTFLGWTGIGETQPIRNYAIPNHSYGDKSFDAHWDANKYTITFDVNGGNALPNSQIEYTYGAFFNLPVPTRDGYSFAGWYCDGVKVNDGYWSIAKDTTLIASWIITPYAITYILNGGINHELNPSGYTFDDETITLHPASREGYTFLGWTTEGVDEPINGIQIPHNSTGTKTFTANWQANTYQVTYDVNGGDSLTENTENVLFYSEHTSPVPTRDGYSFNGWFCNGKKVNDGVWKIASNCTLKASWIANNYTITKHNGSGAGTSTVTYDSDYYLGISSKDGYDFQGWFTGENGTGTQYTDSSGNSINNYTDTENIDLFAFFTYTVTFESNGGSKVESVTYKENEALSESIVATKKDRTFGGWYTDAELTKPVSHSKSLGNCKLYAKWSEEVAPTLLNYTNNAGKISISGTTSTSTSLILPDYIGGILVTEIKEEAFISEKNITDIVVPDSVTSIGHAAFKGCSSLVSITLPFTGKDETSTGYTACFGYIFGAYSGESGKTGATYTDWVTSSGYSYTYYRYFTIPQTIKNVTITRQTVIHEKAFMNCSYIESITIPNDVDTIEGYAFYNCSSLSRLNSSVDGEFNIPQSVKLISNYSFYGCSRATEVTLSNNIPQIGDYAFAGCIMIERFNSHNALQLVIPSSCKSIGENAFRGLALITDVVVPDSVTTIGQGAFYGFDSLVNLKLPFVGKTSTSTGSLGIIGYIFGTKSSSSGGINQYYASGSSNYYAIPKTLKNVVITNQISLSYGAFYNCSMVEKIILPIDCSTSADKIFYNCNAVVEKTYVISASAPWNGLSVANSFESGSGTVEDPYIIASSAQLSYLAKLVSEGNSFEGIYFKLINDLNLNGFSLVIGSASKPFRGIFDGGYHILKNLTINSDDQYCGLFPYLDGEVKNLGIVNVSITSTSTSNHSYVGVVAYSTENSVVSNCYSTGIITGNCPNYVYVGGFIGYSNGTISCCYSSCTVIANSTNVMAYAGGFAGYVNSGNISHCFASGNATAKGANEAYSRNGGFAGYCSSNATVENCFKSSSQVLTRYASTESEYCTIGETKNIDELYESIGWNFHD